MEPEQVAGLDRPAAQLAGQRLGAHAVKRAQNGRLAPVPDQAVGGLGGALGGQSRSNGEGQVDVAGPVGLEQGLIPAQGGGNANLLAD